MVIALKCNTNTVNRYVNTLCIKVANVFVLNIVSDNLEYGPLNKFVVIVTLLLL